MSLSVWAPSTIAWTPSTEEPALHERRLGDQLGHDPEPGLARAGPVEHHARAADRVPTLPARTDVELFVDFEGQGVNNKTDGTVFGLLVRTKRGRPRPGIHVVASDARSARKKAWFAFLLNVWQVDRDGRAPIFHFGNYDRALMEGMLRLFGGPTSILSRFIDVHPIAARYSVIADRSTSAKAFAQALKLPVRHPAMRGRDAVALWDTWLETGEARHLRKLTEYNEDDLRALLTITDWLREPQRA